MADDEAPVPAPAPPSARDAPDAPNSPVPRLIGRSGRFALAGAAFILLMVVGGAAWLSLRNADALARATRTQQINAAVVALRDDIVSAESGQRGFLLTGKRSYLAPYERANANFQPLLGRLGDLTSDDRRLAGVAAEIKTTAMEKMNELAETIRLDDAGNRIAAMELVNSDRGQTAMDRLRALTGTVADLQRQALTEDLAAVKSGTQLLLIADGGGLVGLVLLMGLVGLGAMRAARTIDDARRALGAANAELARSNETLEDKVLARTSELTAANDEIQRFAYIVSHDLRAPLVNIMGFTSELELAGATVASYFQALPDRDAMSADLQEAVEESMPEAIGFIKTSTTKMDRLIRAILQLAREGRRVLAPERVRMRDMMESIAETLAHQLTDAGAEIVVGMLPDVVTDRVAVEQVFSNLLENAAKYLKPGRQGRIEVSGRNAGTEAIFDVRDNGRGIDPRDLERVFELFRRAGDQSVPGEGIGLAHVRALVRRLGGSIDCESKPDVGSTFRVRLPLVLSPTGAIK